MSEGGKKREGLFASIASICVLFLLLVPIDVYADEGDYL